MKKCLMFLMLATSTILGTAIISTAQPFLIENGVSSSDAVRIMGSDTWLSFYDGSLYDGFLWNNFGNIALGTSHLNPSGKLRFYTYGQERMAITPGGLVGIGQSNPSYKLHVESSGTAIHGSSISAYGLYGYSSGQIGIYGYSNAAGSAGIFGQSAYIGVEGITNAGSTDGSRQGVRGDNGGSATGWAGYFYGNVGVSGTLTKGAGSFKIDHPLDPENKYLSHSFVESPDMKNFYDGIVTTDGSGNAQIILPDWFVALNRDFRYQLTVIDQFAQAIVSEKIASNSFRIKTNIPSVEVSWQVTATRKDAYAEQHRIPVEEYKLGKDRGKYLHPDVFGQPMEKAVDFQNHQKRIEPNN